ISMGDVASAYRRGAADPFRVFSYTLIDAGRSGSQVTNNDRGFTPTHINDAIPARLYSMSQSLPVGISINLPNPLSLYSDRDVPKGTYSVKNKRPDDMSSISAGRDIVDLDVVVYGVGDLIVEAGRDIKVTRGTAARFISAGDAQPADVSTGSAPTANRN